MITTGMSYPSAAWRSSQRANSRANENTSPLSQSLQFGSSQRAVMKPRTWAGIALSAVLALAGLAEGTGKIDLIPGFGRSSVTQPSGKASTPPVEIPSSSTAVPEPVQSTPAPEPVQSTPAPVTPTPEQISEIPDDVKKRIDKLTLEQNFDGRDLDSVWQPGLPWGGPRNAGTGEIQTYVSDAFKVADGKLNIVAEKVAKNDYTSGMLTTAQQGVALKDQPFIQRYGYFEMKAKIPKGQGMFPAFWLGSAEKLANSNPGDRFKWPPEIDIMEAFGQDPKTYYATNHFGPGEAAKQTQYPVEVDGDLSKDYHRYGLLWEPGKLTWYFDGRKVAETDQNVPKDRMYILLNLAIAGDANKTGDTSNWHLAPNASTPFGIGNALSVDSIKVYSLKP